MGNNTEGMIKGAIAETIVNELLRDLKIYPIRFGKEHFLPPITQLEYFITECGGNFNFMNVEKELITSKTYLDKLPDFVAVFPNGFVHFLEVKYLQNAKNFMEYHKLGDSIFDLYPTAHILFIMSSIDEHYLDHIGGESKDELRNTHFHIWGRQPDENHCISIDNRAFFVAPFFSWLKEDCGIKDDSLIKKYEDLVSKWLPANHNYHSP